MKKPSDPIGMFDSGLGGLTVMKALKKASPYENIIYFGDTARVPYGGKSRETIIRYSVENAIFLMEQNIKVLVIACNTASSHAAQKLKTIFNIPVVDVIEPGAERAVQVTQNKRIAILGTKATINSGAYTAAIQKRLPGAFILPIACPLFVPLVEEQFLHHPATLLVIKEYLKPILEAKIDTVLLGCTHYPVLKPLIEKELGPHIHIVDSATTCADSIAHLLKEKNLAQTSREPAYNFFVTDDPDKFKHLGKEILGESIAHVEPITLNALN
jgi:glutamate racemase